jgi:hypothetical protein
MTDDELDPGAPTAMFQAFMDREDPEEPRSGWVWAGLAVVALAAVLGACWIVFG